jgi:predicted metal-binding protein
MSPTGSSHASGNMMISENMMDPIEQINRSVDTSKAIHMKSDENDLSRFVYLEKAARELGAIDAKVVPASNIIVENRVRLKCRAGCMGYGKRLTCPPYVPTVDEFRKILSEYQYALLVKFSCPAKAEPDIICSILKYQFDPKAPIEKKEKADAFMKECVGENKRILLTMLELEKIAFNAGNTFAMALTNGSCRLCENCNIKNGVCNHPTMARLSEHAVGINMKKTAEKAGMAIRFPVVGNPTLMAVLLID